MKNHLSKLINIYSYINYSGTMTTTLLVADDLAGQGYKTLVVLQDTAKLKKACAFFEQLNFLSNTSDVLLTELYMLLEAGKMDDERLPLYTKKLKGHPLHLAGPNTENHKELTQAIFKFTGKFDFVFYIGDSELSYADMNIRITTQEELMALSEDLDSIEAEIMIIGQYKHYRHLSAKKIARWFKKTAVLKVTQAEDVNRSYHKDEILLRNQSIDKDIDAISREIVKKAVIR